ncbi:MAG: hypothetical protein AAB275_09635, partial [Deltaproteobacteria bacterium]
KRIFKVIGWSFLWLISFWSFLIISFPAKTAKGWLTDRLEKGLNAKVSIEEMNMRWNLDLRLRGISIIRGQGSVVSGQEYPLPQGEGGGDEGVFTIKIGLLTANPRLLSLIRLEPEIAFTGSPSSGGNLTGSYDPEGLSLSFKDILFKDFTIATLPVPSTAMFSGSGRLKFVKGKGTIEVEVNGIPGGKQRTMAPGGEGPGLDGKLKVTVSIPGVNLPQ